MLPCATLALWLLLVNVAGYFLAWHDKRRARTGTGGSRASSARKRSRVPERRFHAIALLGGGPGIGAAFLVHRHKTRKRRFLLPFGLASGAGAAGVGAAAALACGA